MLQIIIIVSILMLTLIYLLGRYNEYYWKKRGVVFYEENKMLGIFWDFLTKDKAIFEVLNDLYKKYEHEPAVGIGSLLTPMLYIIDLRNVKHVLQTDFQSFSHRIIQTNEKDLLAENLLFMNGPKWKLMRQKMSPLFTAAKLRNMFYTVDKSAQDFIRHLKENPRKLKGNGFDTVCEYCGSTVAAAVFGIGTQFTCKSPFIEMVRDAFKLNWWTNLKFSFANASSELGKFLGLISFKKHEEFFVGAIKQVLRAREIENAKKHDFADICLSLQRAGVMRDSETGQDLKPTDELLAGQGFFFFVAGVNAASTSMFGALIELGKYPEIQKKLQEEIDETFQKHDGKITYDIISEMKYLDRVLSETLRIQTPIGFLNRKCVRDSVLPVGNIRVSKGTNIYIPIYDLHMDPKYFPEPEVFDPERFSPENKVQSEMAYLPFGKGGRACLGLRYARLQIMAGLLHLLRNYNVVSRINKKSRKFVKGQFQVRRVDTDIELIPRTM